MKIRYTHISDPDTEKIYDTEISLKRNSFIKMSQEDWDKHELEKMNKDKKNGLILSYRIMTNINSTDRTPDV